MIWPLDECAPTVWVHITLAKPRTYKIWQIFLKLCKYTNPTENKHTETVTHSKTAAIVAELFYKITTIYKCLWHWTSQCPIKNSAKLIMPHTCQKPWGELLCLDLNLWQNISKLELKPTSNFVVSYTKVNEDTILSHHIWNTALNVKNFGKRWKFSSSIKRLSSRKFA